MHRSGTTMISKMLCELGLFIGWYLEENMEARFFYEISERILHASNGSWDNPTVIDNVLNHPDMRKQLVNTLQKELSSYYSFYYLGPKYFIKYRSVYRIEFPWGWKDPRNTFLLPLWLDIFPDAKVIHIYRNGIDVAKSLSTREIKRINEVLGDGSYSKKKIISQQNQLKDYGLLIYGIRKVQSAYKKVNPLGKYMKLGVESCISIEKGFELWCTYLNRAFSHIENISNRVLNIKYEEFLSEPEHYLRILQEFCDLPADEERLKSIAGTVEPNRKYAFKNNENLLKYYNTVKDNYWMKKLGYN